MRKSYISALTLASLILAGCGGGSSGSSPVSDNGGSSSVAGTLSSALDYSTIGFASTATATITLNGSTNVSNLAVTVASSDATKATVSPASCTLSTSSPTCTVTVTGVAAGSTNITASASGYTDAASSLTLVSKKIIESAMINLATLCSGSACATPADAIAEMDARCASRATALSLSGTYKAVIASSERSTTTDWTLAPNMTYTRADGTTVIGTTNSSSIFGFPLTHSFGTSSSGTWTGLNADWTVSSSGNCSNWTSGTGSTGTYGMATQTNSTSIRAGTSGNCSVSYPTVYCAEQ